MTVENRDTILEAADILQTLSGNNGMCNLQKKQKRVLYDTSQRLRKIVENDIHSQPERVEEPEFVDEMLTGQIGLGIDI